MRRIDILRVAIMGAIVAAACGTAGSGRGAAEVFRFDPGKAYAREANFALRPFDPTLDGAWIGNAVSYGPYRDGQAPGQEPGPSEEEILQDLRIMEKRWHLIRIYGSEAGSERILEVIRKNGIKMKVLLGIWIEPPDTPEKAEANRKQIESAVDLANRYPEIVMAINVGNETQVFWTGHKVETDQLIQYIRAVRGATRIPVSTADDYNFWNKPESRKIAEEVDFVFLHLYALWNGQQLENALAWTEQNVGVVKALHPDRTVVIGESGWATTYNPGANGPGQQGSLIKGVVNDTAQAVFFTAFNEWVDRTKTATFHFEAFDENWKGGGAAEGPYEVEKHWGLFDTQRRPKPAIRAWFPDLEAAPPSLVPPPAGPAPAQGTPITLSESDHPKVTAPLLLLSRGNRSAKDPAWWGDEGGGATNESARAAGKAWFSGKGATGTGWGFGWSFYFTAEPTDGVDITGGKTLLLEAKITRGAHFQLMIEEAGAAASDAAAFTGARGADGESFEGPKLEGTGEWKTYRIPLKDFVRRGSWGNQKGNLTMDLAAISWMDLFFGGGQGNVVAELGPITAEP